MNKRFASDNLSSCAKKVKVLLHRINAADFLETTNINAVVKISEEAGISVEGNSSKFSFVMQNGKKNESATVLVQSKSKRGYALRPREKSTESSVSKNKTDVKESVAPETKNKRAEMQVEIARYTNEIEIEGTVFRVGEVVLAKIRGYPPWPAVIKEILGFRKLEVIVGFFASTQENIIAYKDLRKYNECTEIIAENIHKRNYLKAVNEADYCIKMGLVGLIEKRKAIEN